MTAQKHPRQAFLLLTALVALAAAAKPILFDTLDPDCFWHLRVADQLSTDGVKPLVDHLAYGSTHARWTPYSWLAEFAMKWVWDAAGFRGAILLSALLSAALVLTFAAAARAYTAQNLEHHDHTPTPSFLAAVIAVVFSTFLTLPYLSFRPASFAILILAVIHLLLTHVRAGNPRPIKWIVLLTALLANVHLFVFLVPLWVAAIGLAHLIARKPARPWATLLLRTTLASLCTPMLPGVLRAVINYQFNDPMVNSPIIAEMQPFYRGPFGLVTALLVLAFFLRIAARRQHFTLADAFLLALSTIALLQKGRYAPLFAIVAGPMLARALPPLSDRVLQRRPLSAALAALAILAAIRLTVAFPSSTTPLDTWVNRHAPDAPGYPCAAAAYAANSIPRKTGRMINEFTWGGYLGWRLGDRFTPLMDGRTQVFPREFWQSTYLGTDLERSRFITSLQADLAILPASKSQFAPILKTHGWTTAYQDPQAQVLVPPLTLAGTPEE